MKRYSIHLTENAENDFYRICAYLEKDLHSLQAKNTFIDTFDEKLLTLSKSPTICKMCEYPPLGAQNIRYILIKQYKAYYWIDEQKSQVNILYIKHCLQDEHNWQN